MQRELAKNEEAWDSNPRRPFLGTLCSQAPPHLVFWLLSLWNGLHFWHAYLLCFSPAHSRPRSRATSCEETCPVLSISPELLFLCILVAGYFICMCTLRNPSSIWFLSASPVPCPRTYPFNPLSQPTHIFSAPLYLWFFLHPKFAQSSSILKCPIGATSPLVPSLCVWPSKPRSLEREMNMHCFHILPSYYSVLCCLASALRAPLKLLW